MGMSALPDMYARSPRAWQSTSAHVITNMLLEIKKIKDLKIGIGIEKKATKQG